MCVCAYQQWHLSYCKHSVCDHSLLLLLLIHYYYYLFTIIITYSLLLLLRWDLLYWINKKYDLLYYDALDHTLWKIPIKAPSLSLAVLSLSLSAYLFSSTQDSPSSIHPAVSDTLEPTPCISLNPSHTYTLEPTLSLFLTPYTYVLFDTGLSATYDTVPKKQAVFLLSSGRVVCTKGGCMCVWGLGFRV